jgi:hypothetical protein
VGNYVDFSAADDDGVDVDDGIDAVTVTARHITSVGVDPEVPESTASSSCEVTSSSSDESESKTEDAAEGTSAADDDVAMLQLQLLLEMFLFLVTMMRLVMVMTALLQHKTLN